MRNVAPMPGSRPFVSSILRIAAALSFTVMVSASSQTLAASSCPLGFRSGSAPTIDGVRGSEWADAAVTASGSACLGQLLDVGGLFKNVTVYSKRYTRGDAGYLGLFLEVLDGSSPTGTTPLLNGERIIVQFDPNRSGGSQLENGTTAITRDHRIDVVHFWARSETDPGRVSGVQVRVYDGSGVPGFCTHPRWNEVTDSVAVPDRPQVAVRRDLPGGYIVELEVPMSLLGSPASDVGVAFAVVNDFASCRMPGVCDGYGLSFPGGLPFTNADNPVQGCGTSWTQPGTWATGYFDSPPGDVYLSRAPLAWLSEDVDGLACGRVDNTYYPAAPCRLGVRANVRNNSSVAQIRNLLYMRGDHSTGPVDWRVVDLREGVSVPAGALGTNFDSAETADVGGLAGHPCVRVYVLPPAFRPDFPRSAILAMTSETQMAQMVAAYGLQDLHWAQQNISVAAAGSRCPFEGCAISRLGPAPQAPEGTSLASAPDAAGPALQPIPASLLSAAAAASSEPPAKPGQEKGSALAVVDKPGAQVLLATKDRDRLASGHVLAAVTAMGSRDGSETATPRYNFIEVIGGIVEAIPTGLLQETGTVAIGFNVGNPGDVARTLFFRTDMQLPADLGPVQLAMPPFLGTAQRFAPDEVRRVMAEVRLPHGQSPSQPLVPSGWLVVIVLLGLLLLAVLWWWRRRRTP